ncbi:MAG: hypothetical protein ACOX7R_09650 [Acetivibrionales bacterium]
MKKIANMLLLLILVEMFVFGTGRLISFGSISLRHILFFTSIFFYLIFYLIYVLKRKKIIVEFIIVFYLILLLLNYFYEMLQGINLMSSISQSSHSFYIIYLLTLPALFNIAEKNINYFYKILINSSAIVSVFCILVFVIIKIDLHSSSFLKTLFYKYSTNDFGFRANGSFFYTGLFYCFIALIILSVKLFKDGLRYKEKIIYLLNLVAIIQSSTRGFIYIFFLIIVILLITNFKINYRNISIIPIIVIIVFVTIAFCFDNINVFFHEYILREGITSDSGFQKRINIIRDLDINELNIFFGQGFNKYIVYNNRIVNHFEISYIEIIVKQGLIGLFFWLYVYSSTIIRLLVNHFKNINADYIGLGIAISLISIMILSLTNPYLTVSMGLFVLAIAKSYLQVGTNHE